MARTNSGRPVLTPLRIIAILVVVGGFYFLLAQFGQVRDVTPVLQSASWRWLSLAVLATAVSVVASVFTQWAAGNWVGRFRHMTLIELSGAFLNHFLPFNVGGTGLMTRYYLSLGLSSVRAVTVSILPVFFGVLTTIGLLAIISPVTLSHYVEDLHFGVYTRWVLLAAAILVGILAYIYRRSLKVWFTEAIDGVRSIRSFTQLAGLLGGSVVITLSLALALYASVKASHSSIALPYLITLFVASSVSTSVAPTPGGLGATETVLVVGMSGAGMPLPQAVASTLIYRFITFWLPIIPGGIALYFMDRGKK